MPDHPSDAGLGLSTATVGSFTVIAVSGEIDMYTVTALRDALEVQLTQTGGLVLDLSGVTFMDSSGLGLLVSVRRRLPDGALFRLAGAAPRVAQLFTLTGLERVFPLYETVEAATEEP